MADWVRAEDDLDVVSVGSALATTRAVFEHRAVVVGADREALLAGLAGLASGQPGPDVVVGHTTTTTPAKTVLVFPGQGSQWVGMGAELHAQFPMFAEAFDAVAEELDRHLRLPLRQVMWGDDQELLDSTEFAQPALFAVEAALFALVGQWGIDPDFVMGHSVGEVTAAYVAGVLTLEDAALLVAARGRLMQALPEGGVMVAVAASEDEVLPLLVGGVDIAAINAPGSVVISGAETAVAAIADRLAQQGRRVHRLAVSHAFHSQLMEPMLEEFARLVSDITVSPARIPVVSNVTAELTGPDFGSGQYWLDHIRRPVRFADSVQLLESMGATRFIEVGPGAGLSAAIEQTLTSPEAITIPVLTKHRPETTAMVKAVGHAFVAGVPVDWSKVYTTTPGRVGLPTYAFQRQRYWLASGSADAGSAGQYRVQHPVLAAAVPVGDRDEWVFTGRLSVQAQPWIADHVLLGAMVVPGVALVELAHAVGQQLDCPVVEELVFQAPLILQQQNTIQVQVTVGQAGEDGRRELGIYSRSHAPEIGTDQGEPVCNARGWLAVTEPATSSTDTEPWEPFPATWPPNGAEPVAVDALYARLAEAGYDYGPIFQGVHELWRNGDAVYAEVGLPDETDVARGFGIHPALLDAVLQSAAGFLIDRDDSQPRMPFSLTGVRFDRQDVSRLRVRAVARGESVIRVDAVDTTGAAVVSVQSFATRPVNPEQLTAAQLGGQRSLFLQNWVPVTAAGKDESTPILIAGIGDPVSDPVDTAQWFTDLDELERALAEGAARPDLVIAPITATTATDEPATARATTANALSLLQRWLSSEWLPQARLVVVTRHAIAADEAPLDLGLAPVWGLMRSAQSEHPGQIVLVDIGAESGHDLDWGKLVGLGEPQLAVRAGQTLVPRLSPAGTGETTTQPRINPHETVLITGGTGGLGATVARHLADKHGVKRLLLVSRRGPEADDAAKLIADLDALGAQTDVVACDVTDRQQLATLLESLERPLGAVVHTAGVLEDGVIESMTVDQLERALRPKIDATWHLHELTAEMPLSAFVMFSSMAGLIGSPGQGNYAAANAWLDALAQQRRSQGLPAHSLAWGLWADPTGMTAKLGTSGLTRLERIGVGALPTELALELFDRSLDLATAVVVPARLDMAALQRQARAGALPTPLQGLVRTPARRTDTTGTPLTQRLATVEETARQQIVLDEIRTQAAVVLGHTSAQAIDPNQAFLELGFDSLTAIEFRNRLTQITGLRLSSTTIFDYPTPARLA
ncbi:SDR family NAD(P)-dependent oxidoreductase, partial [Nocardia nepalensis]|uniref:type I polyketide synthase n=1 Tax=Nocardia nepalensis TaxID=3375448 RepID=UPI003B67AAFB